MFRTTVNNMEKSWKTTRTKSGELLILQAYTFLKLNVYIISLLQDITCGNIIFISVFFLGKC